MEKSFTHVPDLSLARLIREKTRKTSILYQRESAIAGKTRIPYFVREWAHYAHHTL
jgi:hypothetical protein